MAAPLRQRLGWHLNGWKIHDAFICNNTWNAFYEVLPVFAPYTPSTLQHLNTLLDQPPVTSRFPFLDSPLSPLFTKLLLIIENSRRFTA